MRCRIGRFGLGGRVFSPLIETRTWIVALAAAGVLGGAGEASAQQRFRNISTVVIPAGAPANTLGAAAPYPLNVSVAGLKRGVAHVTVSLFLTHTYPQDVGLLLVGPNGQTCELMGRCGGSGPVSNIGLIFDDDAPASVPAVLASGTYRPSTCVASSYAAPAPSGPYGTSLSVFNGAGGNGIWSLYVQDFASNDVGRMETGWQLSILEAGSSSAVYAGDFMTIPAGAPTTSNGPASVYPSAITVSGLQGSLVGVGVRLNGLTHTFPADLDILLVGPNGDKCMLLSDAGGGTSVANVNIGFTHNATLTVDTPIVDATTYRPTDIASGPDTMPAPAPVGPYAATFDVFNGKDPNGTWLLYVYDDTGGDVGSLNRWDLLLYIGERCPADINNSGNVSLQDIFDFLAAYFAGCA